MVWDPKTKLDSSQFHVMFDDNFDTVEAPDPNIKHADTMERSFKTSSYTYDDPFGNEHMLIPQVRPAHKYPISPWEMIHPLGGDNAICMEAYTVYTAVCNKSLTANYQCKIQIPSNKLLANKIVNNN
jgi:hypothetical protein